MIVSFIAAQGQVSDVTRRGAFEIDHPELALVDERGMVTGRADGNTLLTVKIDS